MTKKICNLFPEVVAKQFPDRLACRAAIFVPVPNQGRDLGDKLTQDFDNQSVLKRRFLNIAGLLNCERNIDSRYI